MFKPLSIAIAVAMGVIILGDALYLGRYNSNTLINLDGKLVNFILFRYFFANKIPLNLMFKYFFKDGFYWQKNTRGLKSRREKNPVFHCPVCVFGLFCNAVLWEQL